MFKLFWLLFNVCQITSLVVVKTVKLIFWEDPFSSCSKFWSVKCRKRKLLIEVSFKTRWLIFVTPFNDYMRDSLLSFLMTVSDFLGQMLPIVGFMYAQPGVAELYSVIRKNGYKIMYLTSRPIGQVLRKTNISSFYDPVHNMFKRQTSMKLNAELRLLLCISLSYNST